MIEQKKCKGSGKAKGHGCGKMVKAKFRKYGLGMECKCYHKWLLNTDVGQSIVAQTTLQATKNRRSLEDAKAESKNKDSLSYLLVNVRNVVHKYIKLRDKGQDCISCGSKWHSDFQAGHFYKAELFSQLKFFDLNIHGQCPKCNIFLEGNLNEYSLRLRKKLGKHKYLMLVKMAESCKKDTKFKWDKFKLKEQREVYKEKIKMLKSVQN